MPYVDVAVSGQVVRGSLKYTLENPVSNTQAVEMLGYSIKRTHTNVHEGNCYVDFKVGSTAISSIVVTQAGSGYDVDNMPRHDSIGDSPSLGVEFFFSGDIESRGQAISLPDYVSVTGATSVTIVAAPESPEFGAQRLVTNIAPPYDYAYRVLYELGQTATPPPETTTVLLGTLTPVYVPVRAAWFALGAAEWCQRFVDGHNASAARAGIDVRMSVLDGSFRITSPTVGFRAYELDRLAYVLCGTSTVRHAPGTYAKHSATTAGGAQGVVVYSLASTAQVDNTTRILIAAPASDTETHGSRYASIQRALASASRATAEAVCGELYTARLRPGHYPIGSVLHAPYPVVTDVEEASASDATDADQIPQNPQRAALWAAQQASLGARPHKSLSITRRQAADGLIKELQDAMNYAIFPPEPGCVATDPHSLPGLMPQYTSRTTEWPDVFPFVYDQNVPHVDNPAFVSPAGMQQYLYEYDIGHQSRQAAHRRRQRVYVTLEDAGGGPDATGLGASFEQQRASIENAGWNGYRCTRVRITTAEARTGDSIQTSAGVKRIRTDAEAAAGGAVTQNISLLFASGPNSHRSIHRALGFEDKDYTRPSKFVFRKPQIATVRTETPADLQDTQTLPMPDGRTIHIANRPDWQVGAAAADTVFAATGIVEGHKYTVADAPGCEYPRYVPVLSVRNADDYDPTATAPFDADFHYRGGNDHFRYYTVLGYQAPHLYNLDSDPLLLAVGVAINERVHAQADCLAGSSAFALLPIGHADHAEPRTYRDGSVYQQAMLNYKLSGFVTAPHAVGADRVLSGFRNFGRIAPNAQDEKGRRWGALAADAATLATRDVAPSTRSVHMFKAGDFGVKTLVLDETTRVSSITLTFSVPAKHPYPYNFGAQEVIILLRLRQRQDPPREQQPRSRIGT
jgi:hypothetical protein